MARHLEQSARGIRADLRGGLSGVAAAAADQLHLHPRETAVPLRERGQPRVEHLLVAHGQQAAPLIARSL